MRQDTAMLRKRTGAETTKKVLESSSSARDGTPNLLA
jgi:hypothetical protein